MMEENEKISYFDDKSILDSNALLRIYHVGTSHLDSGVTVNHRKNFVMNGVLYKEISAKIALNRLKRSIPAPWDLNIYRGCAHNCQYCYAQYSHRYLEQEDFFKTVFIKTNIAEALDKQLSSKSWKHQEINFGGVCDSYQPIEAKYELMRDVLKVMIKHKNPMILATKSALILRDLDLISELSRVTKVNIAVSIAILDETLRKKIEPFAAPALKKFDILKRLKKAGAHTVVLLMPIMPYINDTKENLEGIFKLAKEANVDSIYPGALHLRSETRTNFLRFLKITWPDLYLKYEWLYRKGGLDSEYKTKMHEIIHASQKKFF